MSIKIKAEHKDTVVGFNNSSLPLGQREDLHLLLEAAVKSRDTQILGYFDGVPTAGEIKSLKGKTLEVKAAALKSTTTPKKPARKSAARKAADATDENKTKKNSDTSNT